MFARLGATLKLGEVMEQRKVRHDAAGIPAGPETDEWPFCVAQQDSGEKHFRLKHGSRVYCFELPREVPAEQGNGPVSLRRLSDLHGNDFPSGNIIHHGMVKIHESSPTGITGSIDQHGKPAGFRIHRTDEGWSMEPHELPATRHENERDFVSAVEEHGKLAHLFSKIAVGGGARLPTPAGGNTPPLPGTNTPPAPPLSGPPPLPAPGTPLLDLRGPPHRFNGVELRTQPQSIPGVLGSAEPGSGLATVKPGLAGAPSGPPPSFNGEKPIWARGISTQPFEFRDVAAHEAFHAAHPVAGQSETLANFAGGWSRLRGASPWQRFGSGLQNSVDYLANRSRDPVYLKQKSNLFGKLLGDTNMRRDGLARNLANLAGQTEQTIGWLGEDAAWAARGVARSLPALGHIGTGAVAGAAGEGVVNTLMPKPSAGTGYWDQVNNNIRDTGVSMGGGALGGAAVGGSVGATVGAIGGGIVDIANKTIGAGKEMDDTVHALKGTMPTWMPGSTKPNVVPHPQPSTQSPGFMSTLGHVLGNPLGFNKGGEFRRCKNCGLAECVPGHDECEVCCNADKLTRQQRRRNPPEKLAKMARAILRPELNQKIREAGQSVDTEPTEGQKEEGNYRKGHVWVQGLDITIENPKGSVRKGIGADGKPWKTKMSNAYGYIRNHPKSDADGDHIDVFLGEHPDSQFVAIIDQEKGGKFDEHKCILFTTNLQDARDAYLANYSPGWKGLGNITGMTMVDFKKWMKEGDTSKAVAKNTKKIAFQFKTDSLLFPLSGRPASMAVAAGAAYGGGAGLLAHLYHKISGTGPVDSEGKPRSVWGDALRGAAAGAAVSGIFQGSRALMGEQPCGTFQQAVDNPALTQRRIDDAINETSIPSKLPDRSLMASYGGPDEGLVKLCSINYLEAQNMVLQDNLPYYQKNQILAELQRAQGLGLQLDPRSLSMAGMGALAGWLLGSFVGGSFASMAGAALGGMMGYGLGKSPTGTIEGQGFYRP